MLIPKTLEKKLQSRKNNNSLRSLVLPESLIDFSSNDFFGLAHNQDLVTEINLKFNSIQNKFNGATGSRLISGNTIYHQQLEYKLAQIHQSESALLFNSGYNANLGILSSIPQKGDTIIVDAKAHSSIKDGAMLSFAKKLSFKHNDSEELSKKLSKSEGEKYVVVESLYSMDGDFCDIENILNVCKEHNAHLIIDEAHTTGVFAEGGGWCVEKGIENEVFARVITFGKAIGSFGAAVLGSEKLLQYLINFARPFIYTTALPLYNLVSIESSFDYIISHPKLKSKLDKNIQLFDTLNSKSTNSYIQSIAVNNVDLVKEKEHSLQKNGFDVRAILSPTVAEGTERLRICLHEFNTEQEIIKLVKLLA